MLKLYFPVACSVFQEARTRFVLIIRATYQTHRNVARTAYEVYCRYKLLRSSLCNTLNSVSQTLSREKISWMYLIMKETYYFGASFKSNTFSNAYPSGRAVYGVGLRPLAWCDCGFESNRGHGCLFLVSVVCSQVEGSATGRSLVQKSPTECMCHWVWSRNLNNGGPRPTRAVQP